MCGAVYKLCGALQLSSLHELLSYAGMGFGEAAVFESFIAGSVSNPSPNACIYLKLNSFIHQVEFGVTWVSCKLSIWGE